MEKLWRSWNSKFVSVGIDPSKISSQTWVYWATRTQQGRNTRNVRLTIDLAEEIRGRFEHGEGMASIAKRIGITRPNVWDVVCNRIWRTDETPPPKHLGPNRTHDSLGRFSKR